jgi:CMP-N-acetylneuraminic acid synthetase
MEKIKILGLITARGGSKRILRKNIKDFCGKPLLAWSIEVGKASGVFDRFILSSDDQEIIEVGKKYGIEIPFIRPAEFATDTATSFSVVKHAVEWLEENENFKPDWIVLLEPSSPGRQDWHIQEAVKLISATDFKSDSLIGVSETPGHFHYQKQLQMTEGGEVKRVGDGEILRNLVHRNQDLTKTYYINSAIYAFKKDNLFDGNSSLWGNSTYGYIMDQKYALDIDTPEDWLVAEVKMKNLLENI